MKEVTIFTSVNRILWTKCMAVLDVVHDDNYRAG